MRFRLIIIICLVLPLFTLSQKYDKDSLMHVLNLTDLPSKKIDILNLLSKSYLEENPVRSESFAQQALFISESINNDHGKAEALFYLGQLAFDKQVKEKDEDYILKALEIFQKIDDQKWIGKSYLLLGDIYLARNDYEKSLGVLIKAMNIFISLNQENKLAETYNLIGLCYYEQEQYNRAFDYLQNGLILTENNSKIEITSSLYNNVANIYLANKNYEQAFKYYNKAISINIAKQKNYCLAINYTHLGRTYLETGNTDSARYFLNKSYELSLLENNNYLTSLIKLNLGKLFISIGDLDKATIELQDCYNLSVRNSILYMVTKVSMELSQLYELQSNYEKAYYYHLQYKLLQDSLESVQNTEKITNQEMKLLFSHEQELSKIEQQKSNLKYFSLVMALLTLLIIIVIFYTRLKIRLKPSIIEAENLELEQTVLRDKLDFKNRELTTNLIYLVKKNELINVISAKLQKAKENFRKENRNKIQEIIFFLQSNVDQNLWQEFEERFQEIHKDFYTKLDKVNPNLSDNDKRLCTFVRLNLSTKEIAGITHQNLNSIEVSRTRLRKKLNITNTDINLHNFLSKL